MGEQYSSATETFGWLTKKGAEKRPLFGDANRQIGV
jgi:hypothetical protein